MEKVIKKGLQRDLKDLRDLLDNLNNFKKEMVLNYLKEERENKIAQNQVLV
jgi:hypothetical protein